MNKIVLFFKLIRPLNLFIASLSVCSVSLLLNAFLSSKFYFALLITSCFLIASNLLNNLVDKQADLINKPIKVLMLKKFKKKHILLIIISFYLLGIIASFFVASLGQTIALVIVLPLLIAYTPILKRIPFLGNMCIGCITAMVFPFTEASLTNEINIMWKPFCLAAFLSIIRELVKDIEDMQGDSVAQISTFPVKYGEVKSIILLRIFSMVFFSYSIFLWYIKYYDNIYLITLLLGIHLPLFLGIFSLIKINRSKNNYTILSKLFKGITIIGLFIIFISELNKKLIL